jgi:DHA1 family multidrug resistance protein-like MFS transporter
MDRRGPLESFVSNLQDVASSRTALTMIGVIFLINASLAFARPVIPLFVDALDPSAKGAAESGLVFASLAITSAVAAFAVGNVAAGFGYRKTLLITIFGAGALYLPVYAAGSVGMLVLLMALVGCFSGGMMPAANALLSINSPPDKQGSAFGMAGSANALAFAVAPLLGGSTASAFGVRSVFLVIGLATLAIAALSVAIVPSDGKATLRELEAAEAD